MSKTLKVTTATGSIYEFNLPKLLMRRIEDVTNADSSTLRQDGEWLQMLLAPKIEVGKPMTIALAPLGDPDTTDVTMRHTTTVTSIEEV